MVINSDKKMRKRKSEASKDLPLTSPKRTKVHAQRKFAQGSSLISSVTVPIKENDKEKKPIDSPSLVVNELLSSNRPNTEDFLTFLCFRGTPVLPPNLDFFNSAPILYSTSNQPADSPKKSDAKSPQNKPTESSPNQPPDRPFVAFGVRKRADPITDDRNARSRRNALLNSMKIKEQQQKMARLRAIAFRKVGENEKPSKKVEKKKPLQVSTKQTVVKKQPSPISKPKTDDTGTKTKPSKKVKVVTQVKITTIKQHLTKRKMCLRSKGHFVQQELQAPVRRRLPPKQKPKQVAVTSKPLSKTPEKGIVKKVIKTQQVSLKKTETKNIATVSTKQTKLYKTRNSRIIANEPSEHKNKKELMPKVKPAKTKPVKKVLATKIIRSRTQIRKQLNTMRITRAKKSLVKPAQKEKPFIKSVQATTSNTRPTRKTKEAAALYMELLGRKLVQNKRKSVDDDSNSIDSFPELPNVRKTAQRENELKAKIESNKKAVDIVNKPTETPRTTRRNRDQEKVPEIQNKVTTPSVSKDKKQEKKLEVKHVQPILKSSPNVTPKNKDVKSKEKQVNKIKESEEKRTEATKAPIQDSNTKLKAPQIVQSSTEKLKPAITDAPKLTVPETQKKIQPVPKKPEEIKKAKPEQSFSDSDDEPLAAKILTTAKNVNLTSKKICKEIEKEPCIKNDIKGSPEAPTFSSDDDEKTFRGFINADINNIVLNIDKPIVPPFKTVPALSILPDIPLSAKSKVNMSNERIKQWLNDSALIQQNEPAESIKDLLPESSKIPSTKCDLNLDVKIEKERADATTDIASSEETSKKPQQKDSQKVAKKPIYKQKQPIPEKSKLSLTTKSNTPPSRKERSDIYAFDDDNDSPVMNTPFRNTPRRPSSAATSRSGEEQAKAEDEDKKFRVPTPASKPESVKNRVKQEVSLTLSTDGSDTAAIALEVDLKSETDDTSLKVQCSDQEDADGQTFYIPLQQDSTEKGVAVAVKLGTDENKKVVVTAKLVTNPPKQILKNQSSLQVNATTEKPPVSPESKPPAVTPNTPPTPPTAKKIFKHKHSEGQQSAPLNKPQFSSHPNVDASKSPYSPSTSFAKTCAIKTPASTLNKPSTSSNSKSTNGRMLDAPVYYPNEKEFQDPIQFIEKIRPVAEKFGLCRIVPPSNFKPECKVNDDMRFTAYNQYVHKMLNRWGPNSRELAAIKKYLKTQSVSLTRLPSIGGMEVDLPRLYQTVQSLGGLKEVIEKKKWPKVAEIMRIPKSSQDIVTKLDDMYCKYLLPYETLSPAEKDKLFKDVEAEWKARESRIGKSVAEATANAVGANKPAATSSTAPTDESDDDGDDSEAYECIVRGKTMQLNTFYRIGRNTMNMWFKKTEPDASEVENEFWKHVTTGQNHICVYTGSIDSGVLGYGFACSKNSPLARHAWNLKVLTNNPGSILRSMGPVLGVTVPTLHVGMVFSACCWYRDPHGLPWIEYAHTGANKIWYGIPDSNSGAFHNALRQLVPAYCRDKTLWLPSDTAMVPPSLLLERGVSLCRTVQEPGQFVVVFPKAFTSTICSGYIVSESVFFATRRWLTTSHEVFKDIRDSCEPSMFSLERVHLSIAGDTRSSPEVLRLVLPAVACLREREANMREKLHVLGLRATERLPLPCYKKKRAAMMAADEGEYECEVCRANLFVSFVVDAYEEGVYCLDHAIEHIEKKPAEVKYCKILYTYDVSDLDVLLGKIKETIDQKSQKKTAISKYAGMPTLLPK